MSNLVHIAAAPHPFHSSKDVDIEVPEGANLAEMLNMAQPNKILQEHAHIFVNDVLIPREYWHLVKPKAGKTVSIGITAGNRNFFRIVLTLGVVFAAFAYGPALGSSLVGGPTFNLFGQTVSSAALGGAIIQVGGALLVNAIAPIRPDSLKSNPTESPSFFLDRAQNTAAIYGPIPVIFGKHRVVPPLGAVPVTEVVGDSNYLRMIVIWGYGPLKITDIRIGDTPITDFDGVRIETVEGRPTDKPLTLYPNDIHQENLAIVLENTNETGPGPWQTRRSAANADELSIDITLPRGLGRFDDEGKRKSNTVILEAQYRRVDIPGSWFPVIEQVTATTIDTTGINQPGAGQITLTGARTQPIRHGIRWTPVEKGQYDVRVRRVSKDETEDTRFSTLQWTALRTITYIPPINFPVPLAMTAIDIKASEQLSQVVSTLNGLCESEVQVYDSSSETWSTGYSRSPASAMRLALQGPARRSPSGDDELDLENIGEFAEFCEVNDYNFDHIHDSRRGLWDLLSDICAVARAKPINLDGRWSVVFDSGTQVIRQHFSPLNASDFSMQRSYADPPHGFRITFANEEADYNRDERIVYNDGYTDANATNLPTLNPVGITNREHIYKFGRFHLAQTLLRREIWTFNTGFEYLVIRKPGHRVSIQHDVLVVGLTSARVIGRTLNQAGQVIGIKVDAPIHFYYEATWGIKIRTSENAHIIATLTNKGGAATEAIDELTFTTPVSGLKVGDLVSIGEAGREYIDGLVTSLESEDDFSARLSLVPFQEGVYQAETGPIPPFDSRISKLFSLTELVMVIIRVTSDREVGRIIGDIYEPGILIEVRPLSHINARIECEIRPSNTGEQYKPAEERHQARNSIEVGGVETGNSYDLRLRWATEDMRIGPWAFVNAHEVEGAIPAPPLNCSVDGYTDGTRRYMFTAPKDPLFTGVRIRYITGDVANPDWDTMTELNAGVISSSPFESILPELSGTYTFLFRSVATDGALSISVRVVQSLSSTRIGGQRWHTYTGVPPNTLGNDGDLLIRTDTFEIYEKKNGVWVVIANIEGADLAIWHSGVTVPANTLGKNGDFYFRIGAGSQAGSVYRKVSGSWVFLFDVDGEGIATWLSGTGVPSSTLGNIGDFYFRTDQGYVYKKTAITTWTFLRDITGPQGIRAATWHTGNGIPVNTLGLDGDLYFRVANNTVWKKESGSWRQISDLTGADGARWHNGAGVPSNTLGENGDWYFRTGSTSVAAEIYTKIGGVWVKQVDIDQGADGATWHSGEGAPSSTLGVVGDWYFRTDNGYVYEKTATMTWTFRRDITGPQATIPPAQEASMQIFDNEYHHLYTAPIDVGVGTFILISLLYTQKLRSSHIERGVAVGTAVIPYATETVKFRVAFSSEGDTSNSDPIFIYGYWVGRNLWLAKDSGVNLGTVTFLRGAIVKTEDGGPIPDPSGGPITPTVTTRSDTIYIRASSLPSAPSGGTSDQTHTPSPWVRDLPRATSTLSVYSATRVLTFRDNVFSSASAWGSVTLVEAAVGVDITSPQTVYRRATSPPSRPTSTAEAIPTGWQTGILSATTTQSVYSITRNVTRRNGVFRFATVWGAVILVEAATGTPVSPVTTPQTVYRRSASVPNRPTSTAEAIPTGWSTNKPSATSTEGVYSITRRVTRLSGVFQSATAWGGVTLVEAATGPVSLAPSNLATPVISAITDDQFTATTTVGTGGTPTLYRWQIYSLDPNDPAERTTTTPSRRFTDLRARTYYVRVRGENEHGVSDWTDYGSGTPTG